MDMHMFVHLHAYVHVHVVVEPTSGLIGSPTEPSSLSDLREVALTGASPTAMSARIAVGAV